MSTQIQVSSPFLKSFTTTDTNVTTSKIQLLAPADVGVKRIVVLVQNTSPTYNIQIMGNANDTAGIAVYPLSSISLDNYNGGLWAFSNFVTGVSVHTSISLV